MTTGSTSIKVTLKEKIKDDNQENEEQGSNEENEKNEAQNDENKVNDNESKENQTSSILGLIKKDDEEDPELIKKAIVPNTQSFVELIQNKVADGNDIELIQKSPSILATIPSYFFFTTSNNNNGCIIYNDI